MDRRQFCEAVALRLRCKWEAPAVLLELSDHIQDHMDALLAAGMGRDEAEAAAVAAMGDPEALGRALDALHSPWPWRIYHAILTAAILLFGLSLCLGISGLDPFSVTGGPLAGLRAFLDDHSPGYIMEHYVRTEEDAVVSAWSVAGGGSIGPYRLSPAGEALLLSRPDGGEGTAVRLAFLVASFHPQPWLEALDPAALPCSAVDDLGNRYGSDQISFLSTTGHLRDLCRVILEDCHPSARRFTLTLSSDRGEVSFTLTRKGGESP